MGKLTEFKGESIKFVETSEVKEGVFCDVYTFFDTDEKDLGIVEVKAGYSTPLQKVLKGDKTLEEIVDGEGVLTVTDAEGNEITYEQTSDNHEPVEVKVGEFVQWKAITDLMFYEICYPPYEEGRFENLS